MSIEKLKIKKIKIDDKKKDGTPYIDKWGNAKSRVSIQTDGHGGKWLSGFFKTKEVPMWKEDQEVELEVTQNGDFLNFEMPKTTKNAVNQDLLNLVSQALTKLGKIELQNRQIIEHLSGINRLDRTSAGTPMPNFGEDDGLEQLAEQEFNRM